MYLDVVRQPEKVGELRHDRFGCHVSAGEDAIVLESNSNGVRAEADTPPEALGHRDDQDPLRLGNLVRVKQTTFDTLNQCQATHRDNRSKPNHLTQAYSMSIFVFFGLFSVSRGIARKHPTTDIRPCSDALRGSFEWYSEFTRSQARTLFPMPNIVGRAGHKAYSQKRSEAVDRHPILLGINTANYVERAQARPRSTNARSNSALAVPQMSA